MKTKDIINFLLNCHPLIILLSVVGLLLIISFGDYFIMGNQLAQCSNISKTEIINIWFGRSLAEFLMFGLGILVGYKVGEDRGFIE